MSRKLIDRREIVKKVAKELKLPYKEVNLAVKAQSQYISSVIQSGDIESGELEEVRMPFVGRFNAHPVRVKRIQKKIKAAKEKERLEIQKRKREADEFADKLQRGLVEIKGDPFDTL